VVLVAGRLVQEAPLHPVVCENAVLVTEAQRLGELGVLRPPVEYGRRRDPEDLRNLEVVGAELDELPRRLGVAGRVDGGVAAPGRRPCLRL
jgi:hypothetical protein